MAVKLYADVEPRRTLQAVGDVLAVVLLVVAVRVAQWAYDAVLIAATPGETVEGVGQSLAGSLASAADQVRGLPLVGGQLGDTLDGASGSAANLAGVGRQIQDTVATVARTLSIVIVVVAVLAVLLLWVLPRVRFARRATAAQRFVDAGAHLELFAIRALARAPLRSLARVSPDPVAAWRRGDPVVVQRLADLELRRAGLRPPPSPSVTPGSPEMTTRS